MARVRTVTAKAVARKRPANAKLTPAAAKAIRAAKAKGTGIVELARKYKVHHSTIQAVVAGETWR